MLTGGGAFFGISIIPDLKNSKRMAAYLDAGGIGLPERDYYLNKDEKSKETQGEIQDLLKDFIYAGRRA